MKSYVCVCVSAYAFSTSTKHRPESAMRNKCLHVNVFIVVALLLLFCSRVSPPSLQWPLYSSFACSFSLFHLFFFRRLLHIMDERMKFPRKFPSNFDTHSYNTSFMIAHTHTHAWVPNERTVKNECSVICRKNYNFQAKDNYTYIFPLCFSLFSLSLFLFCFPSSLLLLL